MPSFRNGFHFFRYDKVDIANDLLYLSRDIGQFLLGKVASILGNVASLVAQFFIMIFIAFYLVRDGREMAADRPVLHTSQGRTGRPDYQQHQGRHEISAPGHVSYGGLPGARGGIALAVLDFPGLFWGTMTALASLIPLVGVYLIWVPIALYLLLLGEMKSAPRGGPRTPHFGADPPLPGRHIRNYARLENGTPVPGLDP